MNVSGPSENGGAVLIEDEFNKRVTLYLLLWQSISIVTVWILVSWVDNNYEGHIPRGLVDGCGLASLLLSFSAVLIYNYKGEFKVLWWKFRTGERSSQNFGTSLLVASMLVSLAGIHFLVERTGGARSMFQPLYLYLPTVVIIVVQKRKKLEYLAISLVLASYYLNYRGGEVWAPWKSPGSVEVQKLLHKILRFEPTAGVWLGEKQTDCQGYFTNAHGLFEVTLEKGLRVIRHLWATVETVEMSIEFNEHDAIIAMTLTVKLKSKPKELIIGPFTKRSYLDDVFHFEYNVLKWTTTADGSSL